MKSITKTSIAGLLALLLCVAEGVMFAADTSAAELQQSVGVRYADLNLDLRCFTDAVAQAVARVDRPALSAYHQQRLGTASRRDATIAQR
jgi:hypothetical protein